MKKKRKRESISRLKMKKKKPAQKQSSTTTFKLINANDLSANSMGKKKEEKRVHLELSKCNVQVIIIASA